MFTCAVKKWKRLFACFPSYGAKCIADVKCKFSRKHDVFTVNCNVSVYYHVT